MVRDIIGRCLPFWESLCLMSQDVAGELEDTAGLQELIQAHLGHDAQLICGNMLCIWLSV